MDGLDLGACVPLAAAGDVGMDGVTTSDCFCNKPYVGEFLFSSIAVPFRNERNPDKYFGYLLTGVNSLLAGCPGTCEKGLTGGAIDGTTGAGVLGG